ncbi:hypothetical protein AncyloWKF20_16420 [Ancylobacter sp. WKF20]|uniref:hypothetical protein n=1 Tax=Ancylobacter sp. WKF20 TaxID=3039801 RepID=UPI002434357D|nr:hypothetical protein [Ancylobacter sp. WKF20]WGD29343.1 hypothetical protein AncyloWKF20_16420 [Ancylobacter sp. WKF20]
MKFARSWALAVVALVAALMTFLPAAANAQSQNRNAPQVRVYLMRGLANIFSFGMDDLTAKLNARGIKASVHSYVDWQTLANVAIEDARAGKRRPTPVIIIGHSLGADAAVDMGNKVSAAGIPVPLVVTFDPVSMKTASAKIGKVVNYYQSGGAGKAVSGPRVDNVDLTGAGQLTHFNIEKAAELHLRVIAMIEKPARPRAPRPAPQVAAPAPATPAATAPSAAVTAPSATETAAAPATPVAEPAVIRAPN